MRKPFLEDVHVIDQFGARRFAGVFEKLGEDGPTVRVFRTSPEEGPDCLCSWCGESIPEPLYSEDDTQENPEDSPAVRLYSEDEPVREARFHPHCFEEAVKLFEVVPADEDEPQP